MNFAIIRTARLIPGTLGSPPGGKEAEFTSGIIRFFLP